MPDDGKSPFAGVLNFIILVCLVPFGIAMLLSLANGSFARGWQRGMERAAEEDGR